MDHVSIHPTFIILRFNLYTPHDHAIFIPSSFIILSSNQERAEIHPWPEN